MLLGLTLAGRSEAVLPLQVQIQRGGTISYQYRGRRDFRAGWGVWAVILLSECLFVAGTLMTYSLRGWNWVSLGLAGMSLVGLGGIIETLVQRVRLTDDALWTTELRGKRRYSKTDISGVEEAKGSPTFLIMKSGSAVKLPSVGSSLGNSIRAWLKSP